jgi:hypothetical protein
MLCSGLCVNTMQNAQHCGSCGHPCAGSEICMGGVCVVPVSPDAGAPDGGLPDLVPALPEAGATDLPVD